MLNLAEVHRSQYRASGDVNWSRFGIGAVLLLLASCLGGVLLILLYNLAFAIYAMLAIPTP
jgi:hypothetical protein